MMRLRMVFIVTFLKTNARAPTAFARSSLSYMGGFLSWTILSVSPVEKKLPGYLNVRVWYDRQTCRIMCTRKVP